MAKGKNLNPADALRKAQRKKELKKNKEQRQKARDFTLVKKDTFELEDEIAELEKLTEPSKAERERLVEAKAELAKIMKKKEEYVEEHPEARNLVYKRRREKLKDNDEEEKKAEAAAIGKKKRNLFNKNGLPRHPERSIYYDPVMNPYGMPPPGMPYAERALLPGEIDSEAEEDGKGPADSDDDIPMPEGPPPDNADDGDSDDDIPLPEGPPPGEGTEEDSFQPPLPPGPPPLPSGLPPPSIPPFPPSFFPQAQMMPGASFHPVPPPPIPIPGQPLPPMAFAPPPPPPGFSFPPANFPPPPPGFFPRRGQSTSSVQDPLSNVPYKTFQAHRAERHHGSAPTSSPEPGTSTLPVNPNLPPKPVGSIPAIQKKTNGDVSSSGTATVSAEPQLRDFKKESTAFVPAALKRKKASGTGSGKVNAAPSVGAAGETAGEGDGTTTAAPKPDLLGSLREKFGPIVNASTNADAESGGSDVAQTKKRKVEKKKDDYDKFLEEMGDILAAPQ